jgi:hypothetical protein
MILFASDKCSRERAGGAPSLRIEQGWGSWFASLVFTPKGLKRYYGQGHLHFITFSCYRRLPLLGGVRARNVLVRILAEVRRKQVGQTFAPQKVCGSFGADLSASRSHNAHHITEKHIIISCNVTMARRSAAEFQNAKLGATCCATGFVRTGSGRRYRKAADCNDGSSRYLLATSYHRVYIGV